VTYFIQTHSEASIGDRNFFFRTHRELFADVDAPGRPAATDQDNGDRQKENSLKAMHAHGYVIDN